ncbi:UNVERIFIED_CONTAM: hypothetical protein PYX00_003997 [Menopon gallinae]|uniref:CHK kinase-like domain-containing protein n=1 Tax=Menopon gallinae TaxID=328185 RepID=A0AAW2I2L8_9NEOP
MSDLLEAEEVAAIARMMHPGKVVRLIGYYTVGREKHGYLGEHLTLTIHATASGNDYEHSFFVKSYNVPIDGEMDFLGETGLFKKEVDLYEGLLQKLRDFTHAPECCPKFYFGKHRVLVLEDLTAENFGMKKESGFFDRDHVEQALKAVAALHAGSVVFERKKQIELDKLLPSCFEEIINSTKENSPTYMWKGRQILDLTTAVDFLDKYTPEEKKRAKDRLPDVINNIYSLSKKSEKWPNVFVHGDMWHNNILFRYEEGRPVDCRIVDFQFSRYAPPMHDVMHFLLFNTEKSYRDANEDEALRIYYDFLSENLALDDIDVNDFCKFETFMESKHHYKLLAIIQCLLSTHYLLGGRKVQEGPELKYMDWKEADIYLNERREKIIKNYFQDPVYAKRVGGILTELIDNYILNDTTKSSSNGLPPKNT